MSIQYVPRLPPRVHQTTALTRLATHPGKTDAFGLLMDMGTGKTKVIVDEWGYRVAANDVTDLCVIAPAGCYLNWCQDYPDAPSELKKHLDPSMFERAVICPWITGAGVGHKERLTAMLRTKGRPRVFVVNCEALSAGGGKARDAVQAFLDTSEKGVIMPVDESPIIKNPDSIRTEVITNFGQHENIAARRILTGLVSPNSPLDVFPQFYFLDWRILGFRSWYGFRARHAIMRKIPHPTKPDRKIDIVVNYRNVDEIAEKIEPHTYRVLKDECLDLPPKQWARLDVELTDEQRRIYKDLKEKATAWLSGQDYVTPNMVLTQRLRLDQVLCGFTMDESGNLHEIPEKRTKTMLEALDAYAGKAIIWTSHDYCIRKLAKVLGREYGPKSVAQFWGGNRNTRHIDEQRFKTDPACRWIIATQGAGSRGNTWTMAGVGYFYNNTDSLDHRAQAEDRNHRDGLREGAGSALYIDGIARGTQDEGKLRNLRKKINLSTAITREPYKDWLI